MKDRDLAAVRSLLDEDGRLALCDDEVRVPSSARGVSREAPWVGRRRKTFTSRQPVLLISVPPSSHP